VKAGTGEGGGGVAVSGVTDDSITTYINASGNICAEPNLKFNGSLLCIGGNIAFCSGAASDSCINITNTVSGGVRNLQIKGQSNFVSTTGGVIGGKLCICGGFGSNTSESGGSATGGDAHIFGGVGKIHTGSATGGDVLICGGRGWVSDTGTGTGGTVHLCGGGGDTIGRIRLSGLPSKVSETCTVFIDASGNLSTGAGGSGGGIGWSGSTANAIGTYADANGICAEPNLTFDGSILEFAQGTPRIIRVADESSGLGSALTLYGGKAAAGTNCGGAMQMLAGAGGTNTSSTGGIGGHSFMLGGAGGATSTTGTGGKGGRAIVSGGIGGSSSLGTQGAGGNVEICGGCGGSGTGNGGHVYICSGSHGTDGCVMLYHGLTKRLHTTTSGMYTTGTHCATTSVNTPILCNTAYIRAGASAENGIYLLSNSCVQLYYNNLARLKTVTDGICVYGNNIYTDDKLIFDTSSTSKYICVPAGPTPATMRIVAGSSTDSSTGGALVLCAGNNTSSGSGGNVCIYAGCAGSTTNDGSVYIRANYASSGGIIYCGSGGVGVSYVALYRGSIRRFQTTSFGICAESCGVGVDWIATSDCRLKNCIVPISNALSTVDALCGINYQLCDDELHENRIGLIAQDVEKILPEVVTRQPANECDCAQGICDEVLGIKYNKLTAVLIEAVKELKTQNECLQNQINELKNN